MNEQTRMKELVGINESTNKKIYKGINQLVDKYYVSKHVWVPWETVEAELGASKSEIIKYYKNQMTISCGIHT